MGRPELTDYERLIGRASKGNFDGIKFIPGDRGPHFDRMEKGDGWAVRSYNGNWLDIVPEESYGIYHLKTHITACMLLMPAVAQRPDYFSANYVMSYMNRIMPHCLGYQYPGGVPTEPTKQALSHALYGLKLLYNSKITTGMSASAAETAYLTLMHAKK